MSSYGFLLPVQAGSAAWTDTKTVSFMRLIPCLNHMEIIFLGGGFVVCFVLKAEKGKHINRYTMNDICSTVQMSGIFYRNKWYFSIVTQIHLSLNFTPYPSAVSQSLKLERRGKIFPGLRCRVVVIPGWELRVVNYFNFLLLSYITR